MLEKQVVAEQAQIFLKDLYVHRFEKLSFYPGLADPVPAIEQVVRNIDTLTSAEMEEAIYRIFVSQRDLHLNYIFPSPYRDFRSFLPLTFRRTASRNNFFEIRVASVNPELFQQFAPGQRIPQIGDRVIMYNNLPIRKAVRKQKATGQGANRFGGFTRALGQMTFIPHALHLVPDENEVPIVLIPLNNGKGKSARRYKITLPWIAQLPAARYKENSIVNTLIRVWTCGRKYLTIFLRETALNQTAPIPATPAMNPDLIGG